MHRKFVKYLVRIILVGLLMSLISCAHKVVYQVDGKPIHTNIVQARVLNLNAKVTYNFLKSFKVQEDDEFFYSYEFLSLTCGKQHIIEKAEGLYINIDVFNPNKGYYKLVTELYARDNLITKEELYEGDISRRSFKIDLPLYTNNEITFFYSLLDEKGNLLFKSFEARYISKIKKKTDS